MCAKSLGCTCRRLKKNDNKPVGRGSVCAHLKKREQMGVVTRAQSLRLVTFKINRFLKTHAFLGTRRLRLCNIVALLEFLSSSQADAFVCRYSSFGEALVTKLFELTSDGLCPQIAVHYNTEIFEKRASRLKYVLPANVVAAVQARGEACGCAPGVHFPLTLCWK